MPEYQSKSPVIAVGCETETTGKSGQVTVVRCKTVADRTFRQLNYVRDLSPYVIEQRLGLDKGDPAPTPLETVLAALGSCLAVGVHANCMLRGITVSSLSIDLDAEFDPSTVWGRANDRVRTCGFNKVRALVHIDSDALRPALEDMISHVLLWSPVGNSLHNPVHLEATLA